MQVFDTPGSVSLRFKLPSGRVVVTTADEPQTIVELVPLGSRDTDAVDKVEITHEQRGGRHVITVEERDQFRWGPIRISWGADVEVRVTCPPGSDLELSGGSTDLRAEGELGEVSARSASGDIRLETATKKLQVKTASGDISIGAIEAGGSVVTVSGDLGVRRHRGQRHRALRLRRRSRRLASRAVRAFDHIRRRRARERRSGRGPRSSPSRATSESGSAVGLASSSTLPRSRATSAPSSVSTTTSLPLRSRGARVAARSQGRSSRCMRRRSAVT